MLTPRFLGRAIASRIRDPTEGVRLRPETVVHRLSILRAVALTSLCPDPRLRPFRLPRRSVLAAASPGAGARSPARARSARPPDGFPRKPRAGSEIPPKPWNRRERKPAGTQRWHAGPAGSRQPRGYS